ncbi:MAG: DHA2 family efflux MFS transporter permease subunit [Alphaproteobacteria bacterium]|nr:DHA2 family efflux MFS transporter permease subunit [Alphaproteobacteria bacterium]MBL6939393.1 DHA2 family efflux MFS transporter permease subunit [Alphaproteobacteria bacterium]MBL7097126.1 DHA2 family efflux MFS transporter permease subunit [Alphaproteobacteria bacterium]
MSAPGRAAPAPLHGSRLAITAIALALGTFMQVLDTTIANVSLPTIAGNLGASTDQGTWVITSFAVSNGIAVPLTGWFMGRFGVVRTFVAAVAAFTLASFLCGIAWSLDSLILFRIMQGAVSGPMVPGSQALLISIFPSDRRATALGIWSITTLVAPIVGPILGGYISDNIHWSWIFLINVPIGIVAAFLCWRNLNDRETPTRKLPIDRVGLILLAVWVGSLQIMLDTGKDADWFSSPVIVLEACISAIAFAAWIIWETNEQHPVVDLSLFRFRNFTLGTIAFCLGYAVFFANVLLLPLWLQTNVGYTATWAGLVAAPSGVIAVLLTPIAARFMARIDARILATVAFVAFAISYFMRANYTETAGFWDFVWPLAVQGVSMSTFFVAMLTISLDGIPPERIPSASGISNFTRITAGGFAASIITTMWDRREALHQSRLADTATAYNPAMQAAMDHLHKLGLDDLHAYALLARNLAVQAYTMASDDLFWISGWLSIAMIPLIWLARASYSQGGATAAAD